MKQQDGLILFITLIILGMMSLLLVSQMQQIILQQQGLNQLTEQQRLLQNLEKQVHRLLHSNQLWSQPCIIKATSPLAGVVPLQQGRGCRISQDDVTYRYVIADMGEIDCLPVRVDGVNYSSRHGWIIITQDKDSQGCLQVHFAQRAKVWNCPQKFPRLIREGIQSWQYVAAARRKNIALSDVIG